MSQAPGPSGSAVQGPSAGPPVERATVPGRASEYSGGNSYPQSYPGTKGRPDPVLLRWLYEWDQEQRRVILEGGA